MFAALLASLAWVGNTMLDKYLLSFRRMKLTEHIPVLFVFLFLITFLTLPWLGGINFVLAGDRMYLFYFVLMILLAIMWNIFYYQGLQKEKLVEFEMINLLTPLSTVLLAAVFFPEEFSWPVFGAAIVGTIALFGSHLRKHHLQFDKYAIHLLLAVILMAMEVMVQNELLQVYSPAALYALRTGILALFFTIYYRPKVDNINDHDFKMLFLAAFLGGASFIGKLYGYQSVGITLTTLIMLLTPIIVSWLDARLYGTPIKRRTIFAFIVIVLSVAYATFMQAAR